MSRIKTRERNSLLQSLKAGVVPKTGQRLIQVGRVDEIKAMLSDIDAISDGGSSFRVVVGEYGAGKTFFINLIKNMALEKKFVTVSADLNPNRRFYGSGGQAVSLYNELIKNMSTKMYSDGGAITSILEKFIVLCIDKSKANGLSVDDVIDQELQPIIDMVNGYDFALVVKAYYKGYNDGDNALKNDAIRWLRGELKSKLDAKSSLGIRSVVNDENFYDQIKLLSKFVQIAGFAGLFVFVDEMVNLYKLSNTISRNNNYEQILRMFNDILQGNVSGLGFLFGGTPEFVTDTKRGLYSYEALQTRLGDNQFAKGDLVDFSGPLIRLNTLSQEDFYLLIKKIRDVFAYNEPCNYLIPDEALEVFINVSSQRLGSDYFKTPRTTIKSFVNFLSILEQNKNAKWQGVLEVDIEFEVDVEKDNLEREVFNDNKVVIDDEFATFKI